MAIGCMVPMRCIISIGMAEETTVADPLLPVSVIDEMLMEKASIQSDGESPMFTCTTVFAADVGAGLDPMLELPFAPPQPIKTVPHIIEIASSITDTQRRSCLNQEKHLMTSSLRGPAGLGTDPSSEPTHMDTASLKNMRSHRQ